MRPTSTDSTRTGTPTGSGDRAAPAGPGGPAAPGSRGAVALWVAVLGLLTAVAPLATDLYLPALPSVATDLGVTASSVQLTLTAFLIGLALGQVLIGPLSDSWGRRGPLLAGTALLLLASAACALAPSLWVLVVARFAQGVGGAAGIVLSRAVITDRASGTRAVRLFAAMMAVNGIAPVLAPTIGGVLMGSLGWRGLFWVLAGLSVLMAVGALVAVPESLPAERRSPARLGRVLRDVRTVLGRRRYVGLTLTFAFSFAVMFAYISASPFVLESVLGLSTMQYTLVFGLNAVGLAVSGLVGSRLAARIAPARQLVAGTAVVVAGTVALLVVVLAGAPTVGVLTLLFVTVTAVGLVLGNAAALASMEVRDLAGTGSAVMGALQFGFGAVVSPLVGSSALGMAVTMLVVSLAAAAALVVVRTAGPVG